MGRKRDPTKVVKSGKGRKAKKQPPPVAIKEITGLSLVFATKYLRQNFNILNSCEFKAFRPGEVRPVWYQNKAAYLFID